MKLSTIAATVGGLSTIIVTAFTVDSRYESRAEAAVRHELLAADRETGELQTKLDIIKIRIDRFVDTSRLRTLTEAEQIELRSLEAERAALLSRLAAKG